MKLKVITKLVAVAGIFVVTNGCMAIPIIGVAGTIIAGKMKYDGDVRKAKEVEEARDDIITRLENIEREVTND